MEFEDIICEKKDHVAKITINRPEKRNAFRMKTALELHKAISDAADDGSIGVIVLTGAGDKAFTAGGDQNEPESPEFLQSINNLHASIINAPKPVIAMVNGFAIGGGHLLHVICDLTIASEDAIFGQNGPRVGSAASGFPVAYLAQVVGQKKVRELWMLCRRYTAREAMEMGLVNKVVPKDKLQEEVDTWCREILTLSPTCLKIIKATYNQVADPLITRMTVGDMMASDFYLSEESKEGVNAFLEKRQPDFNRYRK